MSDSFLPHLWSRGKGGFLPTDSFTYDRTCLFLLLRLCTTTQPRSPMRRRSVPKGAIAQRAARRCWGNWHGNWNAHRLEPKSDCGFGCTSYSGTGAIVPVRFSLIGSTQARICTQQNRPKTRTIFTPPASLSWLQQQGRIRKIVPTALSFAAH